MTDASLPPQPAPAGYGAHARGVLGLGVPLIGSHLAQMALQVTDAIMLGWYSVEALAAGVLGTTIFFTFFVMGSGFAWAVMPLVAHAAASGDETALRRATRMGMWLSVVFALAVAPVMWGSAPILRALGQEAGLAALTQDYLRIAGLGMAPALLVMVLKSHLAALERTRAVLWITVAAAVLNVGVNWVLIFGNLGAPEMGVRGAAIASVTVATASLVAVGLHAALALGLRGHALFARLWRPDAEALGRVFRLGWPIGLTNLAESGLFTASSLLMGWIGTRELAAHGIALQVTSVLFMIQMGLSNAATIRAGRAEGARDRLGLQRGAVVVLALSMAAALATVVVLLTVPGPLVGLFLGPDEPERAAVIAIGVTLLAMAALFQLVDAAQVVVLGLLRGVQDTRVPMIFAAVSYWLVGVPLSWAFAFPLGMGPAGIWLGLAVGLAVAAATMSVRLWRHIGPNAG
ncbi:MAG: MATE family efflux transporter [Alkalilacustris sp.]